MRLEVGIIALVEEVFGIAAERRAQFDWLRNKPCRQHFGEYYDAVMELYAELGGNWEGTTAKTDGYLIPDAYFPEPYRFIFEFDELQTFHAIPRTDIPVLSSEHPACLCAREISAVLSATSYRSTRKRTRAIPTADSGFPVYKRACCTTCFLRYVSGLATTAAWTKSNRPVSRI